MKTHDEISEAGTKCGAHLLSVTEDMCDASGSAGPGMAWKHQAEVFEMMLDSVSDGLRFFADRAEPARALFLAQARLAFHGAMAPATQSQLWRNEVNKASDALRAFEKVAA